jgi:hypothetical protein
MALYSLWVLSTMRDFGQPANERAFRTMVESRGAVLEKG